MLGEKVASFFFFFFLIIRFKYSPKRCTYCAAFGWYTAGAMWNWCCLSACFVYTIQSFIIKPHMQGARAFSYNMPPALLAEWPGSFACYCGNTGLKWIPVILVQIKKKFKKIMAVRKQLTEVRLFFGNYPVWLENFESVCMWTIHGNTETSNRSASIHW